MTFVAKTDCINYTEAELQFYYNAITGDIIDRKTKESCVRIRADGYGVVHIRRKEYILAHRLAYLLHTGEHAASHIDHIDGARSNNTWDNLRLASRSENNHNAKLRKDSKTGVKGVYWSNKDNRYVARIRVNKKSIYGGYFRTLEEAEQAVLTLRNKLIGEFTNHG